MAKDKPEAPARKTSADNIPVAVKNAPEPTLKNTESMPEPVTKKSGGKPGARMVRERFSIPKAEHQKIAEIKEACLSAGLRIRKSEVLRAGLKALGEMNEVQLKNAITGLQKVTR